MEWWNIKNIEMLTKFIVEKIFSDENQKLQSLQFTSWLNKCVKLVLDNIGNTGFQFQKHSA
jgi:hypothetical protein